jgi:hypothetical protein
MPDQRSPSVLRLSLAAIALCALLLGLSVPSPSLASKPRWHRVQAATDPVDLAPRSDGRLVVAASGPPQVGRLWLWKPAGRLIPFARGPRGYSTRTGEAYIDAGSGHRLRYAGCSFGRDTVYALDALTPGIVKVSRRGITSRFANLPAGTFLSGITFDRVGRFGYGLLVTAEASGVTTVYGIDCRGRVRQFARAAVSVEGGMRVAPRGFGRFGGQLIMPDELSGTVYAASSTGAIRPLVGSGVPSGPDIGIESLGFVPPGFDRRRFAAYVSSAHGDDNFGAGTRAILSLGPSALHRAGLRPGDLLGASELAGTTVAIRCSRRCSARTVARGPAAGHIEGHIVFAPVRRR